MKQTHEYAVNIVLRARDSAEANCKEFMEMKKEKRLLHKAVTVNPDY